MPSNLDVTTAAFTGTNMKLGTADDMTYTWGSNMAKNSGFLYWRIRPLASVFLQQKKHNGTWYAYDAYDDFANGTTIGNTTIGTGGTAWYCPHTGLWRITYGYSGDAAHNRIYPLRAGWYFFVSTYSDTGTDTGDSLSCLYYVYGDDSPGV